LLFVHALRESEEPVLSDSSVVITFERRRCAAQYGHAFLDLRSDNSDIARVISGRFFLFVCRFVFFIDNDESEIFQRREDRATRADCDASATRMNFMPFIVTFALGQMAMQHRDRVLHVGEAAFETLNCLGR
jgi:hypothetical protein